jgi:formylglycine-generating enzyme required for sulfatase activity
MEEESDYHIETGTDDHYKRLGSALTAPDHPVVGVSWRDAVAYCAWLSARTGHSYRLPSETEWEYAGRGGPSSQGFPYAGGYRLEEVGWFRGNSRSATHPVGLKKPNELGLYDMSGNVWEWCADHWQDDYGAAPLDGSPWQGSGGEGLRVVRGGSWNRSNDDCRLSNRDWIFDADGRTDDFGFRPARY